MPIQEKDPPATVLPEARVQDKEYAAFLAERVGEINSGIEEFHKLLERYSDTVEHEGLREQLETLESWMRLNAESLSLAVRIFEMGPVWLDELHQRLALATDELERLTDEGGPPAPPSTQREREENEQLTHVWHSANNVMESMSQLFAHHKKPAPH